MIYQMIFACALVVIGAGVGYAVSFRFHRLQHDDFLRDIERSLNSIGIKRTEFNALEAQVRYLERIVVQLEKRGQR